MLNPAQSDKIVKVVDVFSGNFVAAALLQPNKNICVVKYVAQELRFIIMAYNLG